MTQKEMVYRHMQEFGSITSIEAFSAYGITRLAARVNELRKDGIEIESNNETHKNRYGGVVTYSRYRLAS